MEIESFEAFQSAIETYVYINWIISIIVLLCFFYLCYNVAKIKNILENWYYSSKPTDPNAIWTCPKCQFEENPNNSFKCKQCGYSLST